MAHRILRKTTAIFKKRGLCERRSDYHRGLCFLEYELVSFVPGERPQIRQLVYVSTFVDVKYYRNILYIWQRPWRFTTDFRSITK